MDVVTSLVTDSKPAKLGQPRQRPLHHPSMPTQPLRTLTLPGYAPLDGPLSQRLRTLLIVVSLVGVYLVGTLSRAASRALYGLYRVQKLFKDHRVVDVSPREHHCEWNSIPIDHDMALCARLPFVRRIRTRLVSPFLAGTEAESREARSHSI